MAVVAVLMMVANRRRGEEVDGDEDDDDDKSCSLGREFDLPDTIRVWDSLFADPQRSEFVLYFCCAMLLDQVGRTNAVSPSSLVAYLVDSF
jgi:hypothetical protein